MRDRSCVVVELAEDWWPIVTITIPGGKEGYSALSLG